MNTPRHWQSRLLSFVPKILDRPDKTKTEPPTGGETLKVQEHSKFAQLPEEILRLVMDNLIKEWKVNVIKTCRYLRRLLEFTLYIHLSPIDDWDEYKCGLVQRTLVGREDLIPHIRSYSAPILPDIYRPSSKWSKIVRFWRRTAADSPARDALPIEETEAFKNSVFVFSRAINITFLEFTYPDDWTSNPAFEPIREAVSKMPLTHLFLRGCSQPAPVLRVQLQLEHLEVWCLGGVQGLTKLQKSDLPNLRSLNAKLEDASLIVPGRPVEQLDLSSGYADDSWNDERFEGVALSTRPITKLSIRLYYPWETERTRKILQLVSRHLREIEQLTIIVVGCLHQQVILDEIPSFISLRSVAFICANLVISPPETPSSPQETDNTQVDGSSQQYHTVADWDDLVLCLKKLCPLLVDVERTPVREGVYCCPSGRN